MSGVGATAVRFETGYLLSRELEDFVWSSETLDDIVKGVRDGVLEASMQTCSRLKTLDIACLQLFVQAIAHNLTLLFLLSSPEVASDLALFK